METVYLETSIIGYLASRISADLVTAANQQLTRDWWDNHRERFELFVSEAVVAECGKGDPASAEERAEFLGDLPVLDIDEDCHRLASNIIQGVSLPEKADVDAIHIAVAGLNGMDYLLTWNCKHIANPSLRRIIEGVLLAADVAPPVICTPQELINA